MACSLGALRAGSNATVDIVVTPLSVGTITNTATVRASESEVIQDNNTATESTTVTSSVIPPVIPPVEAEPANPQVPVLCTGRRVPSAHHLQPDGGRRVLQPGELVRARQCRSPRR